MKMEQSTLRMACNDFWQLQISPIVTQQRHYNKQTKHVIFMSFHSNEKHFELEEEDSSSFRNIPERLN